jgi:hypothetical protein
MSAAPMRVAGLPPAIGLAVAYNRACARMRSGSVQCWGANAPTPRHPDPNEFTRTRTPIAPHGPGGRNWNRQIDVD